MHRADNFHPLDRIDPQVGFHVGGRIKHVLRIAGALGHDLQHHRGHIHARNRCGLNRQRRGRRGFRDRLMRINRCNRCGHRSRHGQADSLLRHVRRRCDPKCLRHDRFLQFEELPHGVLISHQRITVQSTGRGDGRHGRSHCRRRRCWFRSARLTATLGDRGVLVGLTQRFKHAIAAHLAGQRSSIATRNHPGGAWQGRTRQLGFELTQLEMMRAAPGEKRRQIQIETTHAELRQGVE